MDLSIKAKDADGREPYTFILLDADGVAIGQLETGKDAVSSGYFDRDWNETLTELYTQRGDKHWQSTR